MTELGFEPKQFNNRVHWKDWCWSWNSNTLATWCEELTHWRRPWCWERLKAGEGADRRWDGWMASPTQWTWVWVNSESWWWTGMPGVLQSVGLQRVRHDWATQLNWTDFNNRATIWTITNHCECSVQKRKFINTYCCNVLYYCKYFLNRASEYRLEAQPKFPTRTLLYIAKAVTFSAFPLER